MARIPRDDFMARYQHPEWQRKRLEILSRDNFTCTECDSKTETLNVHHRYYEDGKEPWEYPDTAFATLCQRCHEVETETSREVKPYVGHELATHGFTAEDVRQVAYAFNQLTLICSPTMFAYALVHLFQTPHLQAKMLHAFAADSSIGTGFFEREQARWEAHGANLLGSALHDNLQYRAEWLEIARNLTEAKRRAEARRRDEDRQKSLALPDPDRQGA